MEDVGVSWKLPPLWTRLIQENQKPNQHFLIHVDPIYFQLILEIPRKIQLASHSKSLQLYQSNHLKKRYVIALQYHKRITITNFQQNLNHLQNTQGRNRMLTATVY